MNQGLNKALSTQVFWRLIRTCCFIYHSIGWCFSMNSLTPSPPFPDDALQLPPTPPSSNHGDSDGSLPPSSPPLTLPPSSPQPTQRPGGRACSSSSSSSSSSSTAISSSPLLTAPHVSGRPFQKYFLYWHLAANNYTVFFQDIVIVHLKFVCPKCLSKQIVNNTNIREWSGLIKSGLWGGRLIIPY